MPVSIRGTSINPEPIKPMLLAKSRTRRAASVRSVELASQTPTRRNDLLPDLTVELIAIADLNLPKRRVRKLEPNDVREAANSIAHLGFSVPLLIGRDGQVIDGELRVEAARSLGLTQLPCIRLAHLSKAQERALRLSSNRIGLMRPYDIEELRLELNELVDEEQPIELLGFSGPELDQIMLVDEAADAAEDSEPQSDDGPVVSKVGDLWVLGDHALLCGDATDVGSYQRLLGDERAQLVLADAPYNVKVSGIVSTQHREFVQGSGEMSEAEFDAFLERFLAASHQALVDGGIAYCFMDWKHIRQLLNAGVTTGYELLNLVCWVKQQGGMGSLLRSQHELIAAFKKPGTHKNNVQLGKHGRDRTNCWFAPGAGSRGSEAAGMLKAHPTSKPPALLADAILDVTDRGDIVLDPFGGSGSTLIACERTGRRGYLMELDPAYCDLIIRRWTALTGKEAIHAESGDGFEAITETRTGLLETIDA